MIFFWGGFRPDGLFWDLVRGIGFCALVLGLFGFSLGLFLTGVFLLWLGLR